MQKINNAGWLCAAKRKRQLALCSTRKRQFVVDGADALVAAVKVVNVA